MEVIIEPHKDGGFIAWFADNEGSKVHGVSKEDAVRELIINLEVILTFKHNLDYDKVCRGIRDNP